MEGVECWWRGFRVQDSGFRIQGPGFRVQGSGFRVQGSGRETDWETGRRVGDGLVSEQNQLPTPPRVPPLAAGKMRTVKPVPS